MKDSELNDIRVIGISSLMTWEGLKAYETEQDGEDKQAFLANITEENQWRLKNYQDSDYPKRVAGVFWNKCYQLENMLISLNKKKKISATVLGLGAVYGKDNEFLQTDILNALAGQSLTVYGNGNNKLPFVHI